MISHILTEALDVVFYNIFESQVKSILILSDYFQSTNIIWDPPNLGRNSVKRDDGAESMGDVTCKNLSHFVETS